MESSIVVYVEVEKRLVSIEIPNKFKVAEIQGDYTSPWLTLIEEYLVGPKYWGIPEYPMMTF